VYKSVTGSIDDMLFGPSMLDVIMQRLTRQAAELLGMEGTNVTDEDLVAQALRASGRTASEATMLRLPGDLKPLEGETSTSAFSAPICDLLLAIFELDEKKNWLRRQAIVIILQQVFGETIERYDAHLPFTCNHVDMIILGNFVRVWAHCSPRAASCRTSTSSVTECGLEVA
jgi:sorting nexin-25